MKCDGIWKPQELSSPLPACWDLRCEKHCYSSYTSRHCTINMLHCTVSNTNTDNNKTEGAKLWYSDCLTVYNWDQQRTKVIVSITASRPSLVAPAHPHIIVWDIQPNIVASHSRYQPLPRLHPALPGRNKNNPTGGTRGGGTICLTHCSVIMIMTGKVQDQYNYPIILI